MAFALVPVASSNLIPALTWAIILVFVTIAFHLVGIALMAIAVPRLWAEDVTDRKSFLDTIPGVLLIITAIAFGLAIFHGIESVIWAVTYFRLAVFSLMSDAILYSLGAMSTGGSGLTVPLNWRLMGAIESFDGLLLFGISTAVLFSIMTKLWRSVSLRHRAKSTRQS